MSSTRWPSRNEPADRISRSRAGDGSVASITRGLVPISGGALAAVSRESGGGRLFFLTEGGVSIEGSAFLPDKTLRERLGVSTSSKPDPSLFVVVDGSDEPVIAMLDDGGAPAMLWAGGLHPSAIAVDESNAHFVSLLGALSGSSDLPRAVLQSDVPIDSFRPIAVDIRDLRLSPGRRISAIASNLGYLYAAIADPIAGCDLYRRSLDAPEPGWTMVFSRGASRFALNAAVSAIARYGDCLLVGTAAMATGAFSGGNRGPELLIVEPDGSWDLIIGQMRLSPEGLRIPASALPPGLDSVRNAAISAIASGTPGGRSSVFIALQDYSGPVPGDRNPDRPVLDDYRGDARIFASIDLVNWEEVAVALPPDRGAVTSLCVTQSGLIVGHEGPVGDRAPVTFVDMSAG